MNSASYSPFHFDTLVWKWPIAVYLFLVGVSVGSVALCIFLKRTHLGDKASKSGIFQATAILGPVAVASGLMLLIFDLVRPWMFWRLLITYQTQSIMSIGVLQFQFYMIVLVAWLAGIFRNEIKWAMDKFLPGRFGFVHPLLAWVQRQEKWVEPLLLVMALALGAYTGFLLAALKSYPMLNNPVLPVLFMVSGLSSGVAAPILLGVTVFKEDWHSPSVHFLHKFELPLIMAELFLFFCFFVGLYYGGGRKAAALNLALAEGFWASVFWWGVMGVGIALPLIINYLLPGKGSRARLLLTCVLSLCGIFMLRFYILYGGQLTVV